MTKSSRPAAEPGRHHPNAEPDGRTIDPVSLDGGPGGGASDAGSRGGAAATADRADAVSADSGSANAAPVWVCRLARMLATTPAQLLDAERAEAPPSEGEPARANALGQVRRLGPGAQAALLLRRRAQDAARRTRTAAE